MKKFLFLIPIFLCSCTYNDIAPCNNQFIYDEAYGVCKNCKGEIGFNAVNLAEIRKTKNAECLYLSKLELQQLNGDSTEIGLHELKGYNFKGSVLDSCRLIFYSILNSDLRGSNLTTLQYGYAIVSGRKDKFTKVPATGIVTIKGDSINCEN